MIRVGPNSVHMRTYRMIIKHVDHVGERTSMRMLSISASSPLRPTDADEDQSQGVRARPPAASGQWRWTTTFGWLELFTAAAVRFRLFPWTRPTKPAFSFLTRFEHV